MLVRGRRNTPSIHLLSIQTSASSRMASSWKTSLCRRWAVSSSALLTEVLLLLPLQTAARGGQEKGP